MEFDTLSGGFDMAAPVWRSCCSVFCVVIANAYMYTYV